MVQGMKVPAFMLEYTDTIIGRASAGGYVIMDSCLNCYETVARLHLYIDRELSVEEVAIVQKHLTDCPDCECRFHFDASLKRLIHERCTIERAPTHLREAVLRLAQVPPGTPIQMDLVIEREIRADFVNVQDREPNWG
jgi:mycothiol system anti-sigma-R factor